MAKGAGGWKSGAKSAPLSGKGGGGGATAGAK